MYFLNDGDFKMIYADNAATTKLDRDALKAMQPFLEDEFENASQPYSFSRPARKALREARNIIAHSIGAESDEIYFTSGGTESDNWAIKGSVCSNDCKEIITSEFEHHAVLRTCNRLESFGIPVKYLHPTKDGFILVENLKYNISDNTKLISIMMVNNEIGTIQPIKELCSIAHDRGAIFHTDAVQAIGHIPIDVKDLGVDMLSASAHKFNGPKGIGFLYVKKGTPLIPYEDGGAQEFGMRAGTENVAGIIGMAVALDKNISIMNITSDHLRKLENIIITGLKNADIDFVRNGADPHNPGNLSLSFAGMDGETLLHRLDLMGIMISTGSACDSKNTEISHVLKAIELESDYAVGTIRISLGRDNTDSDAMHILEALIKVIKGK